MPELMFDSSGWWELASVLWYSVNGCEQETAADKVYICNLSVCSSPVNTMQTMIIKKWFSKTPI